MTVYRLKEGDTLVVSVDDGAWETITLKASDFKNVEAATAEEVAQVIQASGVLSARVDGSGNLVLATPTQGGHTSLEIDRERSSAAGALGLLSGPARISGSGLQAARLVSLASEPFSLPKGAEMAVVIDGKKSRITFDKKVTTAAEVAQTINAKAKGAARASRDGRVILTSPSVGPGSSIEVQSGRAESGEADAAAILGFSGAAALARPHSAEPGELRCVPASPGLTVTNLTSAPIELHFTTGAMVLPARGSAPLPSGEAAYGPLQRLIEQGAVRLS
jgi:hypothetical protein